MLLILFDRLISRTRSVTDLFADHSDLMDSNGKHSDYLDTLKVVHALPCKNHVLLQMFVSIQKCAVFSGRYEIL